MSEPGSRTFGDVFPHLKASPRLAHLAARPYDDPDGPPPPGPEPSDVIPHFAMEADLCPSGSGPCGCGGGPPRICSHPDRPLRVHRPYCLACVARQWWEAAG